MSIEHHPAWQLLLDLQEALLDEDGPLVELTRTVVILETEDVVPAELATPAVGIVLGAGRVLNATGDTTDRSYDVVIVALQSLAAPGMGGRGGAMGVAPYTPGARAGVLDLLWAAVRAAGRTNRGGWRWTSAGGESATETRVSIEDECLAGFVARRQTLIYERTLNG